MGNFRTAFGGIESFSNRRLSLNHTQQAGDLETLWTDSKVCNAELKDILCIQFHSNSQYSPSKYILHVVSMLCSEQASWTCQGLSIISSLPHKKGNPGEIMQSDDLSTFGWATYDRSKQRSVGWRKIEGGLQKLVRGSYGCKANENEIRKQNLISKPWRTHSGIQMLYWSQHSNVKTLLYEWNYRSRISKMHKKNQK